MAAFLRDGGLSLEARPATMRPETLLWTMRTPYPQAQRLELVVRELALTLALASTLATDYVGPNPSRLLSTCGQA